MMTVNITVDSEFSSLIPPLSMEERAGLESSIKQDGCLDALRVWRNGHGDILLDGHNRLDICNRLGIGYRVEPIEVVASRDDAKIWIIQNQFNRRNLAPYQRAELALKLEGAIAAKAKENQRLSDGQGVKGSQISANHKVDTRKEVAKLAGVSHDTIAKAKVISEKASEEVKQRLREQKTTINREFKEIAKQERKKRQAEKQAEAVASVKDAQKLWNITSDQSVVQCHALITDPPYGILDQHWEPSELGGFTRDWLSRWNRCGADIALIFWSQRYLFEGRKWFDEELSNYQFQQLLVWHYPNNKSPQSRMGFKQTWEPIFFYRKRDISRQIGISGDHWGDGLNDFDCHVAAVPQSNFNGAEQKVHPAQKPVSVFRWLVNATTQPGETVCDPFAGSGTSGIAAAQLKRYWHGIENNPNYLKIAEQRLATYV